jgi:hypothetical protein
MRAPCARWRSSCRENCAARLRPLSKPDGGDRGRGGGARGGARGGGRGAPRGRDGPRHRRGGGHGHGGRGHSGRAGGGADRSCQLLKSKPTAFSTNESKSATRSLRQLARSARQGAREVPHGLRAQQTVTMASMGGGEERENTPRELLMVCGSFSAQLDPLPGLLRLQYRTRLR